MTFIIIGASLGLGFLLFSKGLGEEVKHDNSNVPTIYDHLFIKYGQKYGLDWKMLKRISWIESNTGKNSRVAEGIRNPANVMGSVSYDGLSWGIMQVTVTTAKDYDPSASAVKLNDPEYSVMIASKHLSFLKTRYPVFNERDLVMSYNHGQGNQLRFIEKEKSGTLKESEYKWGRDYWSKYQKAKELIP